MSRIEVCFSSLKENQQKALVPFITAGDPSIQVSLTLMHTLVDAGANCIELGVPFSDPVADGPVIQRASERALAAGITTDDVFELVSRFRQEDDNTPVILMGYLNSIEVLGYEAFAEKASAVGVDGVLVVDLPPEESGLFSQVFRQHDIDQIFLISPTTHGKRLQRICEVATGFLYYVSLKGVTGSDRLNTESVAEKMAEIRAHTRLPLGVGFGIKDEDTAKAVAGICNAVIIGSALVERIADNAGDNGKMKSEVSTFIRLIRSAIDKV